MQKAFPIETKGVTRADLSTFFQILNVEASKPSAVPPAQQLGDKGVSTIHIVEAEVDDQASRSKLGRKKTLLDWYAKAIGMLGKVRDEFQAGGGVDLKALYHLVDDMTVTIHSKGYEPYLLLPYMAAGDDAHLAHSVNVGVLSCALGNLCGLNSGQINSLCAAAFLHDLGRLTIPVEWTENHTPLTLEEKEIARQHTDWGFLLLAHHAEVPPQAALLAAVHHDAPIPAPAPGEYGADLFHKLLHVADVYDLSLSGERRYWKKSRRDRVLKRLLRRSGRPYEPALLKLLTSCVGYYPPGTMVRLSDGQRGIVVRPNRGNVGRPKVFLFEAPGIVPPPAADGTPQEEQPAIVDLEDLVEGGLGFKLSIDAVLDASGPQLADLLKSKQEFLLAPTL